MSKLNIQKVSTVEDRTLPAFAEFDRLMDRIRERAYKRFAGRGFGDGHDVEDWLTAEREACWPAAELLEDEEEFTLKVALAGFDSEDITVTANPRELIVKAAHETKHKEGKETEESKIRWSEFRSNDVYRRVELPTDVDVDKIEAKFKRGLLTIEAPKSAENEKLSTEVKVSTAA